MPVMSYSGASVTAPSTSTSNDEVFFKAIFDHIFAQHNATDATVAAAKADASALGVLLKMDANGASAVKAFAIAPVNNGQTGLRIVAPPGAVGANVVEVVGNDGTTPLFVVGGGGGVTFAFGQTVGFYAGSGKTLTLAPVNNGQEGLRIVAAASASAGSNLITVVDHDNTTPMFAIAGTKKAYFYNDVTLAGGKFIGDGSGLTGVVAASATAAAALTNPVLFTALVADYKASPGSAGQITVAAGGPYEDSNGQYIAALGAQTANLPTQPTGTHTQYVAVTLAPTTGAPVVTAAAVDAAVSTLVIPSANKPVAVVLLRGATTNPGYIIAAGDIFDIRNGGGAGAGSGGTGGAPSSASYWVNGAPPGALSSGLNTQDPTANGYFSPALLKTGATDGSILDLANNSVSANLLSSLVLAGSNAVTVNASTTNPVEFVINGRIRTLTANVTTSNTASGTGTRYLIADISGGAGVAFTLGTTPPNTSYLMAVAAFQVVAGVIDLGATVVDQSLILPIVNSTVVRPLTLRQQYAGGALPNGFGTPAGAASTTLDFPCAMSGVIWVQGTKVQGGTPQTAQVYMTMDSTVEGNQISYQAGASSSVDTFFQCFVDVTPGAHAFGIQSFAAAVGPSFTNVIVTGFFWRT